VDLLEQAYSGSPRTSYLPIYYAMLDLAKVVVLCKGWLGDLHSQRLHGASWSGIDRVSHDLLTDHITVYERGAFALFYQALVGEMWPKSGHKDKNGNWVSTYTRRIFLRDIYPYIASVGFEYEVAYGEDPHLTQIEANLVEVSPGKWRIEVAFPGETLPAGQAKRKFKILSGLIEDNDKYVTRCISASDASAARSSLDGVFRWHLLYPQATRDGFYLLTPRSNSNFLLPKEIPCLLTFFHLSNVVRYDPERLARLFDSRACALLEILRRHATYDYLIAVWSFLMQAQVAPTHS
jgi:hypothetical protein